MLQLDHILYAVPDLQKGIDDFESLTGVCPEYGGRHPHLGTHNALVSLGDNIYFELIAPDPSTHMQSEDIIFGIGKMHHPKIITWAVCTEDMESLENQGFITNRQKSGRKKDNGEELKWQTAEVANLDDQSGLVPFVIDWGDTSHPSQSTPKGCSLIEFSAIHPSPERFTHFQSVLDFSFKIIPGQSIELKVKLNTPKGVVEIS